jgi:uncharacterized protein YdcH (DUF465 family)
MNQKVISDFKNWFETHCPNFYKQTILHNGDFKLILEFTRTRKFDIVAFCSLMEKICGGEFKFTIEAIDLISKSNLDFLKLMDVNDEVDDLISEDEATRMLGMKDVTAFRKSVIGKGYLTALELPDQPDKHFIKKHVLWHKEVRSSLKNSINRKLKEE